MVVLSPIPSLSIISLTMYYLVAFCSFHVDNLLEKLEAVIFLHYLSGINLAEEMNVVCTMSSLIWQYTPLGSERMFLCVLSSLAIISLGNLTDFFVFFLVWHSLYKGSENKFL